MGDKWSDPMINADDMKKISKVLDTEGYTQREWDRAVGIGTVPEGYRKMSKEEVLRRYEKG